PEREKERHAMSTRRRPIPAAPIALALGILAAVAFAAAPRAALAGVYHENFDAGLAQNAQLSGSAAVTAGHLQLTRDAHEQIGSFIIDDLDPAHRIEAFTATFSYSISTSFSDVGDGISFFLGSNPNAAFGEEGPGARGLTLSFDTYYNGGDDARAVDIKL